MLQVDNKKKCKTKFSSSYMGKISENLLHIRYKINKISDLQTKLKELPKAKTKDDKIISKYISELQSIIERIPDNKK